MTTGQRIKEARKATRMTQKELAGKLGIAYQTLAQWENDLRNPKYDTLHRIADALGVGLLDLCGDRERELYKAGFKLGVYGTDHDIYGNLIMKGYTFSTQEEQIVAVLSQLNSSGQQKAVERVEELTEIPRYRAETPPPPPPASPEGKDTVPPSPPPESPENGG